MPYTQYAPQKSEFPPSVPSELVIVARPTDIVNELKRQAEAAIVADSIQIVGCLWQTISKLRVESGQAQQYPTELIHQPSQNEAQVVHERLQILASDWPLDTYSADHTDMIEGVADVAQGIISQAKPQHRALINTLSPLLLSVDA